MKKTLLFFAVAAMALFTSCDLINKKSENKDDSTSSQQSVSADSTVTTLPGKPEMPVPDNQKAKKIIAKFNQGPAINNIDYADALEYAEIYLTLTERHIEAIDAAMAADDKFTLDDADRALLKVEKEYPYNAELLQILYQAAELTKTEGGLVPMNDDNRARFEALVLAYDGIGK